MVEDAAGCFGGCLAAKDSGSCSSLAEANTASSGAHLRTMAAGAEEKPHETPSGCDRSGIDRESF